MSKFKVGDRITWGTKYVSFVVESIEGGRVRFVPASGRILNTNASWYGDHSMQNLEEIGDVEILNYQPKSPVVEKTVKSIEPGVYNKVEVEFAKSDGHLRIWTHLYHNPTASELESAAKTFMELAQFLREKE